MISNAPFFSGKSMIKRQESTGNKRPPVWLMLALVLTFAVVALEPALMLFALFVVYSLSGWVLYAWRWRKAHQLSQARKSAFEEPDNKDAK